MITIIYSGHRGVEPDAKESCPGGGGGVIWEFRVGPGWGVKYLSSFIYRDTNLFCDANRDQLLYIRMVLTCFEAVTGLKVSLGKSEVVPIDDLGNMADLVEILCCKIGRLPMTCLGIPLGLPLRHFLCGILT